MTATESILAYLVTQLSAPGAANGAKVFRSRQEALNRDEGTGILVQPEEEPADTRTRNMDLTTYELTVIVTVLSRASSSEGLSADQVADPFMQAAHKTIMQDILLGGRAAGIFAKSKHWEFQDADQAAVAVEMRYIVKFQTRSSDLSALV